MATTNKRFVAKNGIDNNGNTITNVGASGNSLGLSGTGALTIVVSGTATLTVPTGTDTLVTLAGIQTVTNKSLSLTTNTLTGTLAEFNTALSDADFTTLTGIETLTNKTLTTPVIAEIDNATDITLDAGGDIILDADGADVLLKDGGVTFASFTQSGGELLIKSGANGTSVLSATALGTGVTSSSLTSVGTLASLAVTGDLTVDTDTLKVDAANNRVGIGTTSPAGKLDVQGTGDTGVNIQTNTSGSPSLALIAAGSDSCTMRFDRATSTLRYSISSVANAIVLDASGNVGIGVTPSAWATSTQAIDLGSGSALWNPGSDTNTLLLTNAVYNGTNYVYKGTGSASYYRQHGATQEWHISPSGTAGNVITFTQAMTLDASGNVGIGVTNPETSRLLVRGSTSDSTSNIIQASNAAGATRFIVRADGQTIFYGSDNGEKARITETGNVGIGTTDPIFALSVSGVIQALGAGTDSVAGGPGSVYLGNAIAGTMLRHTAERHFAIDTYSSSNVWTERLRILRDGNVGIGTASPTVALDVVGTILATSTRTGESLANTFSGRISVTLADGATYSISASRASAAVVNVYEPNAGIGGAFFTTYSPATTKLAGNGEATDTGSTFAVYKSTASHTTTLKNRSGGSRTYEISVTSASDFG